METDPEELQTLRLLSIMARGIIGGVGCDDKRAPIRLHSAVHRCRRVEAKFNEAKVLKWSSRFSKRLWCLDPMWRAETQGSLMHVLVVTTLPCYLTLSDSVERTYDDIFEQRLITLYR
ncbi:uncharacterized protein B0J16DRAFT_366174 [Fusarium flagelliforme]|uniref:uncharacterized protein n=1 Tax=Fusarium flagelliforme TaxID=2675880 RepID=UPI001E8CEB82|nr:uncharacterized protein B0J16DRAFT_366174 [Fusarium flagelliforme]KAH7196900.1 hypothetical protein B0J16DRAFT_366174 [Fusarium flagelliforme]